MRLFRCRAQPLLAIRFILGIVTIKPNHFAVAFERENMGRDPIEEPTIVGDYHGAAGEILSASSRARNVFTSRSLVGSSSNKTLAPPFSIFAR